MKKILILFLVGLTTSCGALVKGTLTGKGNIDGSLFHTYPIMGNSEIKLVTDNMTSYPYELVNKSTDVVELYITTAEGNQKLLKNGDDFKVDKGVLNNITIRNKSNVQGHVLLNVTLKNQSLEMPKAEIINK